MVTTILWGSTFAVTQTTIAFIPECFYMGIRFGIAGICFFPFYKKFRGFNKHNLKVSCIAALLYWSSNLTQTIGLKYTSVSKAGFLTGLNVIMVPILLAIFFKQKASRNLWIGVILATIGTAVLSFFDTDLTGGFSWGDPLILICALTYAIYIIYLDKHLREMSIIAFSSVQMIFVSLYSFGLSLILNDWGYIFGEGATLIFNIETLLIFLYMGVIATAGSLVFQIYGQRHLSPTKSAIIFALEPVFATIFGILFGIDQLSTALLIGAAFIFAGILISERKTISPPEE
ncbi:MAG: EamA family transporter [Candidatus Lokiarchaeota archaeon]|nr:EamA family transporter [Candidatus Lokiarchaeota archaeon]